MPNWMRTKSWKSTDGVLQLKSVKYLQEKLEPVIETEIKDVNIVKE